MKTFGTAQWDGGFKDGHGAISTKSGAMKDYPYGVAARFEGKAGTNPEELIGAAHAGCFTMALAMMLGLENLTAEHMDTRSDVELEKDGEGFAVKKVHLTLRAKIPGTSEEAFHAIATKAKENCPISKLLNATITMDASLVS